MITFPNAKINLGLRVIEKRPDGFHNIETCFLPVPWRDILEIVPAKEFGFTQSGIQIPGDEGNNLCIKAYDMLKDDFNIPPVHIYLRKNIPVGGGLAGGSADGTETLKLLNSLFDLQMDDEKLSQYALQLGSDCPVFVKNIPAVGKGRGEILSPIEVNLKNKWLVLVNPNINISTAAAFSNITPGSPDIQIEQVISSGISNWKSDLKNDFEDYALFEYPVLNDIKNNLYSKGALYTSMTGTGSTIFGIFNEDIEVNFSDFITKKILLD